MSKCFMTQFTVFWIFIPLNIQDTPTASQHDWFYEFHYNFTMFPYTPFAEFMFSLIDSDFIS